MRAAGMLMALLIGVSRAAGAEAAQELVLAEFVNPQACRAAPWPDREGAAPTSRISLRRGSDGKAHPAALCVAYEFPSEQCTQVKVDFALPPCENYSTLSFWCRGDGSGNELQVWTGEQARGWHGVGKVVLDFTGWREIALALDDNYTALAHTLRFIIRQSGGLGKHEVLLDGLRLIGPVDKRLPRDFSVGPKVTQPPPFRRRREFRLERRRVGDRTVLLLDGAPLMCVLDARPSAEYLEMARRAGMNCVALDLYWRDLEPLRGFSNWHNLKQFVRWLGEAGFAVAMLVNIHQPRWLLACRGDEPLHGQTLYPNSPLVRREFERFLGQFLPEFSDCRNVVVIGVAGGGEADANFPEVPGTRTPWRRSAALLADFRAFLRGKYGSDAAWRRAWGVEGRDAGIGEARPPEPLGPADRSWVDLRRSWHDWREFIDQWWVLVTEWQARLVHRFLPGRLVMVRFGWPVFQCENVFLIRQARQIDMVQCKDAVASWEQATPWFLVSRAALYHGAVRGTEKINFPEVDVGHDRGRPSGEDMLKYLPPLAPWIGALWYYRGLHASFVDGLGEAIARLVPGMWHPTRPKVAVFYGQKYANWTQNHTNYANEAALAGAARVLGRAGIPFTVVSEFTLGDLRDMKALILADNPLLPREAAGASEDFVERGGALIVERWNRRHLDGSVCRLGAGAALELPEGFFASVQPRGRGLEMSAEQSDVARRVVALLRRVASTSD